MQGRGRLMISPRTEGAKLTRRDTEEPVTPSSVSSASSAVNIVFPRKEER
jgi:hypothetical protein